MIKYYIFTMNLHYVYILVICLNIPKIIEAQTNSLLPKTTMDFNQNLGYSIVLEIVMPDTGMFSHGVGGTWMQAVRNAKNDDNASVVYGISYFPSVQIKKLGKNALRITAAPTAGLSETINPKYTGSRYALSFGLPLDVELHFGDLGFKGVGGQIGIGTAYHRILKDDLGNNSAFGPHLSLGIRTGIWKGRGILFRASYLRNQMRGKDEFGYNWKDVLWLSLATNL